MAGARRLGRGILGFLSIAGGAADAAVRIDGQVQAGGGAVASSTVTLWAGSAGEPRQLAQATTADDGSFALGADETPGPGESLYVIAKGGVPSVNKGSGDNPALSFLAVLGGTPPAHVTINEMTTIASVWTNAQFLDLAAIKGPALSLSIAAGNVPNFVNLQTGGWGGPIQDPLKRPDADDGEFRHARRCARWLRDAGHGECLRHAVPGGQAAQGGRLAGRHPVGG